MAQRLVVRWRALSGNVRGAIWALLGGIVYVISIALVKVVGARLPVVEILLFRQVTMLLLITPVVARSGFTLFRTARLRLHMLRAAAALFSMLMGFTAVVHLPLADATALGFSQSLFTTIFAVLVLAETVGLGRWSATVIGFVGVVVMLRPGSGVIDPYALAAIAGAASSGLVAVLIRRLSRSEVPLTIMLYQLTPIAAAMAIPTALLWVTPTLPEMVLILGIGICSIGSQLTNILAYRAGEAAAVTPLEYTRLVFAAVTGVILFGNWPTVSTVVGALIIIGASVYTLHREVVLGRRARVPDRPA